MRNYLRNWLYNLFVPDYLQPQNNIMPTRARRHRIFALNFFGLWFSWLFMKDKVRDLEQGEFSLAEYFKEEFSTIFKPATAEGWQMPFDVIPIDSDLANYREDQIRAELEAFNLLSTPTQEYHAPWINKLNQELERRRDMAQS